MHAVPKLEIAEVVNSETDSGIGIEESWDVRCNNEARVDEVLSNSDRVR